MSQTTALILAFIMYGIFPMAGLYLGYLGFKKLTKPKVLEYKTMPKLAYIPLKQIPPDIKFLLDIINQKGDKLRMLYGDTNGDGKIDDQDIVNETYVMINKLLDEHIPQAMKDYRNLNDLGRSRAEQVVIHNSELTGKQALLDILNTVNAQFDDLLEAIYHQDGQKLLITNRYLRQRFENHRS